MTDTPIAERDVYRPTMSPVRNPSRAVQVVLMQEGPGYVPGPSPGPIGEPLVVADGMGSNWLGTNVFEVGQTVEARSAEYSGGVQPVDYQCRFQTRATDGDYWTNTPWITVPNQKTAAFFELTEVGQVRFQTQAKDAAATPVTVSSVTGIRTTAPAPGPLTASTPVVSGTPMVGEVLGCSQPVVTGGVPPYSFDYSWTDVPKLTGTVRLSEFVPSDDDVGNKVKCVVTVTDRSVTRQSVVVNSNDVGPIVAHPPEVTWREDTKPTAITLVSMTRFTIEVAASGYYELEYLWQFQDPDGEWVNATIANVERLYPNAAYTLMDGLDQSKLNIQWFGGTPGPTAFRCRATDTAPDGATNRKWSTNCLLTYPA